MKYAVAKKEPQAEQAPAPSPAPKMDEKAPAPNPAADSISMDKNTYNKLHYKYGQAPAEIQSVFKEVKAKLKEAPNDYQLQGRWEDPCQAMLQSKQGIYELSCLDGIQSYNREEEAGTEG